MLIKQFVVIMCKMENMGKQRQITDFWFGELFADGLAKREISKRWYITNPDFDRQISVNFKEDIEEAKVGKYDDYKKTPEGSLALILLFDQFTRNVYRGTKQMFSCDVIAQEISRKATEKGFDRELHIAKRQFIYMPLMHAENLELQEKCVGLFRRLRIEVGPT